MKSDCESDGALLCTPPLHCTRAEPQVQYITKTMSGISIKLEFAVHKLPYIIKFKFCQTRISCWLQVLCNMITQIINHSQYLSVYFNVIDDLLNPAACDFTPSPHSLQVSSTCPVVFPETCNYTRA